MATQEIADIAVIDEALARLKQRPPGDFSPDELTDGLTSLGWIRHRVDILIATLAVTADDREATAVLGYPTSAALLAHTTPLAMYEAYGLTKRGAKTLGIAGINPKYEPVQKAYENGEVSGQAVDKITTFLTRYRKRIPDGIMDATVATLITAGMDRNNPKLLDQALAGFREEYAPARTKKNTDGEDENIVPAAEDRNLDALRFWRNATGRWTLEGDMNVSSGEMLATALSSINPQNIGNADGPPRTPEQLRHDAFEEILRRCLTNGLLPNDGGVKPTVTVTCDIRNLLGGTALRHTDNGNDDSDDVETDLDNQGHLIENNPTDNTPVAEPDDIESDARLTELTEALLDRIRNHPTLDWSGAITTDLATMIACDANITPVPCADGKPLALGRTQRFATIGLRRYLITRDRGCIFPGCDRPPAWCDMHHFIPWEEGGRTDPNNCGLVCRHHHTTLHTRGWEVCMGPNEVPLFTPPTRVDPQRRSIPANGRKPPPDMGLAA